MSLISLENITKVYGTEGMKVYALQCINMKIAKGEFVAIMGTSGSGKSTLMNILGCLDRPTAGDYYFNGQNTKQLTKNQLARLRNEKIGFIFQSFNLLSRLTALENIEVPMLYKGIPREERRARAAEILERMGLGDRMHHYPNQLSGGQRQRVAIGRALVNAPSVLLADEPTGNLDTKTGMEIMGILHTLHQQGATIVLVTHDSEIASYADRMIVLRDGKIVSDKSA